MTTVGPPSPEHSIRNRKPPTSTRRPDIINQLRLTVLFTLSAAGVPTNNPPAIARARKLSIQALHAIDRDSVTRKLVSLVDALKPRINLQSLGQISEVRPFCVRSLTVQNITNIV